MLFLVYVYSITQVSSRSLFTCSESFCPSSWIGDGFCDSICMNSACNYDSLENSGSSSVENFIKSDCFFSCMDKQCAYSSLGDKHCDTNCNNYECGWDLGDCGFCQNGCEISMLENGICDEKCNFYDCRYDNNDCGWCAEECYIEDLINSTCQDVCNNYDCNYDEYACLSFCSELCPLNLIGDTFCDNDCNNEGCNYDGGDCDCDIGCNTDIYYENYCRKVSEEIDDPCASSKCDYKRGLCGYCNAGCYAENLGNGICDKACNVEDCSYDFGDCGCNDGCSTYYKNGVFTYSGSCEKECLVPECGYNLGKCSESKTIQAAILNQILKEDWSSYYNSSLCTGECDDTKSYTYTNLNKCSTTDSCNKDLCLNCYGNVNKELSGCLKNDGVDCLICNSVMILDQCKSSGTKCPVGYVELDVGKYFGGLERWCFVEPTKYSVNHYKKFYVNPKVSYTEPGYYGDGSEVSPMVSLYYALISVYASHTKILLDCTVNHTFSVSPSDAQSPFVDSNIDPLNTNNWYKYEELWIESASESVRAIVYWTPHMKISPLASKFYIRNIDFYGTKVLKDCTEDVCLYCPYVEGSNYGFIDDRKKNINIIDYQLKYGTECPLYNSDIIFNFKNSAVFENVKFIGFRFQYSSFIYTSGSLVLKNVDFLKMQAKNGGSVIAILCTLNCDESTFYYQVGTVQDIGDGYEDTDSVTTGNFFWGSGYHSATFDSVQFSYNFAFSNLEAASFSNLIYSENQIGIIIISNCTFDHNYVNNLIYIDVSSLAYSDYYVEYGISTVYSQTHFQLLFTNFTNNYCSNYFLYYHMLKVVHNIEIKNVTINNAIVGDNGIIILSNEGTLESSDEIGEKIKTTINNKITNIKIPSRSVVISGLTINSGKCGGVILQISTMPNVYVTDLIISNIQDGKIDDIFLIITEFKNSGRYLSFNPPFSEILSLECERVTSFTDIYYLKMVNIEIYSTSCIENKGTGGLYINSISTNVTLDSFYIRDINYSAPEAIACYMKDISAAYLNDLFFSNIINQDDAVIEFYQVYTINLTYFTGNIIKAEYTGVVLFTQVKYLTINQINIMDSFSYYGDGGCISITASSENLNLILIDGIFIKCIANSGSGGGIYLDSISTMSKIVLDIENIMITDSKSMDGTAIYISSKVIFDREINSLIKGVKASRNIVFKGGIISDFHEYGILELDDMFFSNNNGLNTGIYGFYLVSDSVLYVKNSIFLDSNSNEGFFSFRSLVEGSLIIFENVTMSRIIAKAFDLTKIELKVSESKFTELDSVISAESTSNVYFIHVFIENIDSNAVVISKNTYFECVSCNFRYCADTVITVSSSSYINITNSNFSNNTAYSTGILYISGSVETYYNTLTNNIFFNNSVSTEGILYFSNTQAKIISCLFEENVCTYTDYNGIYSSTSNLIIIDSEFYSQTAQVSGGFIFLLSSETSINYSKFSKGISNSNGGAIYASGGSLNITHSDFWLNQATNYGGSLYLDSCKTKIFYSNFYQSIASRGDAIYSSSNTLTISNSEFYNSQTSSDTYSASIVTDNICSLEILNTQFKDPLNQVGGILGLNTGDVLIQNSSFININTNYYGAATFTSVDKGVDVIIKNSIFSYNNSTGSGAAVHIENTNLEMTDCDISYNKAEVNGGGLYLVSPMCSFCMFYIKGDTKIVYNSCEKEGGAIKWLDSKPYIEDTVIIENNTAIYGPNFASKATSLNYKYRRLAQGNIIGSLQDVAPGQSYEGFIEIYLYDLDGNIVKTDNSSMISVTCPSINKLYYVSGNTTFIANEGKFSISSFIPSGPPGKSMEIALTTTGITVSNNDANVTNSVIIELNLRECINGEAIGSSSCDPCPVNKYLITPEESCKTCPTGAECTGKDVIIALSGYWRSNLLSEVVYSCTISSACLGGNKTNFLGYCSTGYSGVLCQSCEIGFSRDSSGKCSQCPSQTTNIVILLSFLILIVFVSVVLVKTTLRTAFAAKALHSIYIKIFTNYLQLVFLTAQFNLDWPTYVLELFNVQKSAATVTEQLFSVDCYIDNGESNDSSITYFLKLAVLCCLPIGIVVISLFVWIAVCFLNDTYSYLRREFFTTIVVLFFLIYPNIVKAMFMNFSCVTVDMEGKFLDENTSIQCWVGDHIKYSLLIAVPGIIVWAIGTPSLVLIWLIKQRRFLHRDENKVIFGFIYNGYKTTHFYWEFVIIYRKIIMITISVFMSNQSTLIQALTVALVLLGSLYLQSSKKPYCFSELNHMESEALFTATLTVYCGLYYLSNSINDYIKLMLFFIIIIGNSYFIIYWIYYMGQAIIDLSLKFFPQIKYYLRKGDAFDDDFNNEDIIRQGTYINGLEGNRSYTFLIKNTNQIYMKVPNDFNTLVNTVMAYELNMFEEHKNAELISCDENDNSSEVSNCDGSLILEDLAENLRKNSNSSILTENKEEEKALNANI
ncbi:hypothetical protein SteCoe_11896 [Stentor coeruleus]|uniref:LNR domain-containing protein n=1 Tax=Stentor coeruleus TaxID=5963 RepID=A0A1R2CC34_9CILI|nr:hypothetical protein SteCoe_11896 [Stentor coeruleus]